MSRSSSLPPSSTTSRLALDAMSSPSLTVFVKAKQPYTASLAYASHLGRQVDFDQESTSESPAALKTAE